MQNQQNTAYTQWLFLRLSKKGENSGPWNPRSLCFLFTQELYRLGDSAASVPELAVLHLPPPPLPIAKVNPFKIVYILTPLLDTWKLLQNSGIRPCLFFLPSMQLASSLDPVFRSKTGYFFWLVACFCFVLFCFVLLAMA